MASQQETAVLTVLLNGQAAQSEIDVLTKKADSLRDAITKAAKDGNTALAQALRKELSENVKTTQALQRGVVDVGKVLNNLSTAKPKELRATLLQLNKQLQFSDLKRGSAEWNQLQANIRRVKLEMKTISAESQIAESRLTRLSNGFNKYFSMAATGVAAITGLSMTFRKLAEDVAKMDDTYADVMKTTGLTHEQVKDLNEEFKKLDTRTSREELNNLARDAGKLGITGKKDILDFVEAGNQINVALGEDLGEGAIKNIGKLTEVYKQSTQELDKLDLKGKMLSIGSAINQLGQSSTASESYLVDFSQRLGGVASQAGISIQNILGYASALDQSGQKVEMSATALQGFIMKLMGDPVKFAKIAGLEVGKFTDLLKTDTNQAIITVLDALSKKGGFQQLIPIFKDMGLDGARAVGVLSSLATNIHMVTEAQDISNKSFAEATSLTNEYNVKNENLMAKLEKARKNFKDISMALGEKLNPILLHSTNLTSMIIRVLSSSLDFFSKYGGAIMKTAAVLAAYTLVMKAYIIEQKLMAFWNNTLIAGCKKLWATMAANPWGAVLVLATALYQVYKAINSEMSTMEKKQKALNDVNATAEKNIAAQKWQMEQFLKTARDDTKSKEERLTAIKQLNELSPEYLGNLTLEEINTNKAKTAIDNYIESLLRLARAEAAKNKIIENETQIIDLQNKSGQEIYDENTNVLERFGAGLANGFGNAFGYADKVFNKAYDKRNAQIVALKEQNRALAELGVTNPSTIKGDGTAETSTTGGDNPDANAAKKALDAKLKAFDLAAAKQRIIAMQSYKDQKSYEEELLRIEQDTIAKKQALYKADSAEYIGYQEELEKFTLKKQQDEIKATEAREKAIAELVKKYRTKTNGEMKVDEIVALDEVWGDKIAKTEEYYKILKSIEDKYDPEKKKNKEAAEQLVKDNPNQTHKKKDLKSLLDDDKLGSGAKDTLINDSEAAELKQLDALQSLHDAEIDEILNYEELRTAIAQKYNDLRETNDKESFARKMQLTQFALEQINTLLSAASNYVQAANQAEEAAITKKYDAEIKAAGNNQKKIKKIEEKRDKELAEKRAEAAEQSFNIQVAMALAQTAQAAINAYSSAAAIPVTGWIMAPIAAGVAVAAGMLQVATIKKQHDAAKAGYASGGFTPSGRWDKEQGVVHSEEFVGNRFAVRNPTVRKVFNIVDEAQRNNTVSSLTDKDFARALDYREAENRSVVSGISNALSTSGGTSDGTATAMESVAALLSRNAEVTERLNTRLNEPFVGEVSITGRKGIKENMDLHNKMVKNANR